MGDVEAAVPGLRCLPAWCDEGLQETLLASIDAGAWSTELRRRVQHFGHAYDYRRRSVAAGDYEAGAPIPGWAQALACRLFEEHHTDQLPDQVIVNEYLPGQGISAHVDCVPCFGPVVAGVSLGSAGAMEFIGPHGRDQMSVWLEPGSLYVMTGPARYSWRHRIVGRRTDLAPDGRRVARGRRVSVTFRTVLSGRERRGEKRFA